MTELKKCQLVQALKTVVALLECDRLESCSDCYLKFVDCEKVEKECAEAIKSVLNDAGYPYPGESSYSEEAWIRRENDGKAPD